MTKRRVHKLLWIPGVLNNPLHFGWEKTLYNEPIFSFFLDFMYLFFREGKGESKRCERNINVWLPLVHSPLGTWPATQACALTGNRTGDPLVHRPALNPLSYTGQD